MPMGNEVEQAWPIYVNGKIHGVYITTGSTGSAMAKQQAQGKADALAKEHTAGTVKLDGPFPVFRK